MGNVLQSKKLALALPLVALAYVAGLFSSTCNLCRPTSQICLGSRIV